MRPASSPTGSPPARSGGIDGLRNRLRQHRSVRRARRGRRHGRSRRGGRVREPLDRRARDRAGRLPVRVPLRPERSHARRRVRRHPRSAHLADVGGRPRPHAQARHRRADPPATQPGRPGQGVRHPRPAVGRPAAARRRRRLARGGVRRARRAVRRSGHPHRRVRRRPPRPLDRARGLVPRHHRELRSGHQRAQAGQRGDPDRDRRPHQDRGRGGPGDWATGSSPARARTPTCESCSRSCASRPRMPVAIPMPSS